MYVMLCYLRNGQRGCPAHVTSHWLDSLELQVHYPSSLSSNSLTAVHCTGWTSHSASPSSCVCWCSSVYTALHRGILPSYAYRSPAYLFTYLLTEGSTPGVGLATQWSRVRSSAATLSVVGTGLGDRDRLRAGISVCNHQPPTQTQPLTLYPLWDGK